MGLDNSGSWLFGSRRVVEYAVDMDNDESL